MVEGSRSALSLREVPMVEPEQVARIRGLRAVGWGAKRIARELKMRRNTVRRYIKGGESAEAQVRPLARRLGEGERREAEEMFAGEAAGNAVVVRELLAKRGVLASMSTVQRVVREKRQRLRAEALATVRYETGPGEQTQADFGERRVWIAGVLVKVFFLVAVLGYSRRIFVRAMLSERQGEWLSGLAAAFRHFGGVTRTLLVDNAGALVIRNDRQRRIVTLTSLRGLLPRLGHPGASLRAVPGPDERQDGIGRGLREGKRAGGPAVFIARGAAEPPPRLEPEGRREDPRHDW